MVHKKTTTCMVGIVFLFCTWTRVFAQDDRYRGWHMGPDMMYGWGMGWMGGIFILTFWILVIIGMVFLVKWLMHISKGQSDVRTSGFRALEILKERYARGEIDKAEFDEKKKDLVH